MISLVQAPIRVFVLVASLLLASSCSSEAAIVPTTLATTPHSEPVKCSTGFVPHDLDHVTSGPGNTASTFDGTGAGLGIGDLDADGDLDIVLANLSNTSSILENTGDLSFRRHELEQARFRGVALIDVSGDGALDIVMTTGIGPPVVYENAGDGDLDGFTRVRLPGVRAATYSMAWTDLGGDGDLDLVTGSYNAELTLLRNSPVIGEDSGVVLHENTGDGFSVTRLSETAQALALIATDIDGDRTPDIIVGNDLASPDMTWLATDDGLKQDTEMFATSSYSTMSLDSADIDNDGRNELFSTDMKPAQADDRYREVDADLAAAPVVDDIQTPENVLNDFANGDFENVAADSPIATTGWSWAGLFGDLDNDGFQDLYVANGMRSDQLFGFLPEARLIEENRAFQNIAGTLTPNTAWGLGAAEGGRGMAQADLDGDGDLDIVLNNLDSPARLYENRLCGRSITVELVWPGVQNRSALGSTIVASANGTTWTREITSSRGYLSAGPARAHIGTGESTSVELTVVWPDGGQSTITDVPTGHHITITNTTSTTTTSENR